MGDEGHFARNSQKTVKHLMQKHVQAQTEMSRALAELYSELSMRPKNKGLLRKWNVASFTLKELENNWNSLQFAFQHLLVSNEPTQTLTTNHIRLRKKDVSSEKDKTDVNSENSLPNRRKRGPIRSENGSDSESESNSSSRRSPRIRDISETRDKSNEKENSKSDRRSRTRKSGMTAAKKSRRGSGSSAQSQDRNSKTEDESLPIVRQSLRRVLEMSKQAFEDQIQNSEEKPEKKSERRTDKFDSDEKDSLPEKSENESDHDSASESSKESDDSSESDQETEKNDKSDIKKESEIKQEAESPRRERKRNKDKIPRSRDKLLSKPRKTPAHVLARQRELYRIRKEKSHKLSDSEANPKKERRERTEKEREKRERKSSPEGEKNKPWSKVATRKTAPHILIKRKEQYYRKKAQKALELQNPNKKASKSAVLMAKRDAKLDKMAEDIANQAPKIYPKSTPSTVVITPVSVSSGAQLSVVKIEPAKIEPVAPKIEPVQTGPQPIHSSQMPQAHQTIAPQPQQIAPANQSPSNVSNTQSALCSAESFKKNEKVRKTPPHILKAKKEYYQHNRETILSKQKEYKKRIATGNGKKREDGENGVLIGPTTPLLSPISSERLEQIEKEANQFRSKLNPGKPIFPKKRWADVKIRVLDTKNDSPNGNSGETVASVNRSETGIPVMSGKPAAFTVDEYDFDRDGSPKPIHTRLEPESKSNHVTPQQVKPVGSTNGTTITTPVNLRKNFKKQIAADWENRHTQMNGVSPRRSLSESDSRELPLAPSRENTRVDPIPSQSHLTAESPVSVPSEA